MADLTEIQSAEAVKIVGSDATGLETTPVNSTSNGELLTADISNNGGTQGAITVSTSAIEAKVGASPLANRKSLTVHNNSNKVIYWGYTSGVTTSTGSPLAKDTTAVFSVGPSTSIYLIAAGSGNNTRITESA